MECRGRAEGGQRMERNRRGREKVGKDGGRWSSESIIVGIGRLKRRRNRNT